MESQNLKPYPLQRSLVLAHSVLFYIFLAYLLDVVSNVLGAVHFLFYFFCVPAKIYFYSGLYGAFFELVSGEEIILENKHIHKNAKRFWGVFTFLLTGSLLMQVVLNMATANHSKIFYIHSEMVVSYLMIMIIVYRKYPAQFKMFINNALSFPKVITVVLLYVMGLVLAYQPQAMNFNSIFLENILSFIEKYIHFLQFFYLAFLVLEGCPEIFKQNDPDKELFLVYPKYYGTESPFFGPFLKLALNFSPPFFVILKALTPKYFKIRQFNRIVWREEFFRGQKLVAITCFSSNSWEAYKIAKEFKKRGYKVIIGGPHVSFMPEEALEFCDSVVVGEAEGVWPQIIKDYENNSLQRIYTGGRREDCHELIYQELLDSPPEVIKDFLEVSRGCKYKCHFCTVPNLSGAGPRTKPVFELVELIKKVQPKYKNLVFIDNNIYNDPAYAKELFKALKPLGIRWTANGTLDMAKNEEILRLAKESGCYLLLFGYEINDHSIEKDRRGKLGMAEKYVELTRKVQKAGILIKATFIVGWDSQNFRGLLELWRYCLKLKPWLAIPYILTPFPGTKVFDEMLQTNRIMNLNWNKYNQGRGVIKYKYFEGGFLDKFFPLICFMSYIFGSQVMRPVPFMVGFVGVLFLIVVFCAALVNFFVVLIH